MALTLGQEEVKSDGRIWMNRTRHAGTYLAKIFMIESNTIGRNQNRKVSYIRPPLRTKIRILIADDHPIFRAALRQIIELDPDITIVAEAHDGQTALDLLPSCAASAVLLDINMPNKDGFEVARAIRDANPAVEVIFLTLYNDERFLNVALDLGAKGYILKESAAFDVIDCIKAVVAGDEFVSSQLSSYLIKRNRHLQDLAQKEPAIGRLTPIELRVL